jgi:amidase
MRLVSALICMSVGVFGVFHPSARAQAPAADAKGKKNEITCAGQQLPYPRQEPIYQGKVKRDLSSYSSALTQFEPKRAKMESWLAGKDIPGIQELLRTKKITSTDLVLFYLSRIAAYDVDRLNSIMEINPDLLSLAVNADALRNKGKVMGPMHGIPVLLKDNIATQDKMHTTAGAAAMRTWKPERDAFLVSQLRKAGAIILGKANLSEWANYMDPCMPSGFSVNGGQTRNPNGPFDTWGSSSGSAVAVASDLVTVSVGSETQGSIIMPAGINGIVGLKSSMGLISRDHIIPLLEFQDVPGPMGRSVTDVAILLGALTGTDSRDPATLRAAALSQTDFTQFLRPAYKKGIRVGVVKMPQDSLELVIGNMKNASDEQKKNIRSYWEKENAEAARTEAALIKAGITVVEVSPTAIPARITEISKTLSYGFRQDLNAFLKSLGERAPFSSLEKIIQFNSADPATRAPYGQRHLINAQNNTMTQAQFDSLKESSIQRGKNSIDQLLKKYQIDVIASAVNQTYAPAGYPALTVPAGYSETGSPLNVVFVGTYLSEPKLLAVGYAYEQATKARKNPDLQKALQSIQAIVRMDTK